MEGIALTDFARTLRKIDSRFRVDTERIAYPYSQRDYPTCGLYYKDKFIVGIPQYYVPRYTIAAINRKQQQRFHRQDILDYVDKYGFLPEGCKVSERLLWRGYEAILSSLTRQGLISAIQVKKHFGFVVQGKRMEFPRVFVHMNF